jgi:hypothetical protein
MPKASSLRGGGTRQVDADPVVLRTRLTEQDQRDLRVIWSRDQRIPTPASRQKWAHHRGLVPTTVGRWFSRRRARHVALTSEATPMGSYDLNPSSPSRVAPHGPGSERTDLDPSSDDSVLYHPSRLDQEANLAAAMEKVTIMDCSGGEAPPSPGLSCHGECVLCVSGALRISSLKPWT